MSVARWCVIVFEPDIFTDPDPPDMVIGPFTSEVAADRLAARINDSTVLGARVYGMYPSRDSATHADLAHWIESLA